MAHLVRASEIMEPPPPREPYSVNVSGSEQPGRSQIYRHWKYPNKLLKSLDPSISTIHEIFEQTANRQPNKPCLGHRPYNSATRSFGPYQWASYQTVQTRRRNFGAGVVHVHKLAGIVKEKYGVGLWTQNRPEWQIADLGCMSQALYTVSLYETLGPSASEFIIKHASLSCVITSFVHVPTLLKLKPRCPNLKIIISLNPLGDSEEPSQSEMEALAALSSDLNVTIYFIDEIESLGVSHGPARYSPPLPSDIVTINFTSGTTGDPKGVVLTHRAAVAAVSSSLCTIRQEASDVSFSYLPLAHIFGRMSEQGALWVGSSIGYFHGDILALTEDLKLLRPTGFISVPRLYNRIGAAIRQVIATTPGIKGNLTRRMFDKKLATLADPEHHSASNQHTLYERLRSKDVSALFGLDRARSMVSGSAPLDPSLHQYLRVVFGNDFIQGYGLTETYAVCLAQHPGDLSTGNCGGVTPFDEVCLSSVASMDYLVTDKPFPRGELLIRGHTLFSGYWKDPTETAKAMLPDGWFRTGDICSVDERGRFTIIDRIKNVLKLAQGEYISPERIENVYLSHLPFLTQAYVHGDSVQTFLVAVCGVTPDSFAPFASRVLGKPINVSDLGAINAACANSDVKKVVVAELERVAKDNKFAGFERVRNVWIGVEPFSVENGLLTPTLKLKRPQTAKRFRSILDTLYEEGLADEKLTAAEKIKPKLKL